MTIERAENSPAVRPQQPAKVSVPLAQPLSNLDQAWRAANVLARANLLPKALRANNPEVTQANVTLVLWYGAELGLAPMQAIQSIYVVNGKPMMSGQLWIAKVREAGHNLFVACKQCDLAPEQHTPELDHRYQADHDMTRCTITIVRGDTGARHTETFTIEEAQKAKLTSKDVWTSWTKRMLQWRAVTNCATTICPEVALGYGLEGEEPDEVATTATALAEAVDARTLREERPAEPDDVEDADVVEEPQQSDEEIRSELLDLAREHQGGAEDADPEDPWAGVEVAEPGSWGGDE